MALGNAQRRGPWALALACALLGACDSAVDGNRRPEPDDDGGGPMHGTYVNPVLGQDCPDPGVIAVGTDAPTYYMVCTGYPFAIRSSPDLITWTDTGAAILSDKPPWARDNNRSWAPEIHAVGKKFVAYFTTTAGTGALAVGAATADEITGPYVPAGAPMVEDPVGVIDAHYFRDDDGKGYLFFKIDANSVGKTTLIAVRELSEDGLSFKEGGEGSFALTNDPSTWEGGVVEAPWVIHRGNYYYLFYSANVYDARYRTGVARATSVLGPYEKYGDPILTNNGSWVGPGHGSVVTVGDRDYFVYHAWRSNGAGGMNMEAGRQVLLDRITWVADWPVIGTGSPSDTAVAAP